MYGLPKADGDGFVRVTLRELLDVLRNTDRPRARFRANGQQEQEDLGVIDGYSRPQYILERISVRIHDYRGDARGAQREQSVRIAHKRDGTLGGYGVRWPQPPLSYATKRRPLPPKAVAAATALQKTLCFQDPPYRFVDPRFAQPSIHHRRPHCRDGGVRIRREQHLILAGFDRAHRGFAGIKVRGQAAHVHGVGDDQAVEVRARGAADR